MRFRPVSAVALMSGALLALTACSSGTTTDTGGGGGGAATSAAMTRTVESPYTGTTVEIPTNPQRIVALWRTGSALAELGVVPVGALEGELIQEEQPAETWAKVKDVPTVGTYDGVDVEKLIATKPDLIVGMDRGELSIDYAAVSQVAPTVVLKIAEPTDVWDNYPKLADLVGKSSDFETREAALDASLAAVKSQYGSVIGSKQVTSLGSTAGKIWVQTSKALTYRRITAAGFGYNPTYTDNPQRYVTELSTENLASLANQDALFYEVDVDGKVTPDMQKVLDSDSWKRLPAVVAGHAFPLTSGTNYTFVAAEKEAADLQAAAQKLAGS